MNISVKKIQFGSVDYKAEVALRSRILREPLGLAFRNEDLALEGRDIHLGAFVGDRLVGCLILSPYSSSILKMRQVAVDLLLQRSGVGRALVYFAEAYANEAGYSQIQLHARETAVSFYLGLGYEREGELFQELGLPHYKMSKQMK